MKKVTILDIQKMKDDGQKMTMLTAYDFHTSRILDRCEVDMLLDGDSVGNVILGMDNPLPVTI